MQLLVPGSLPGNWQLTTAYNFADEYRKIFTPRPPAKDGTPAPALGVLRGQLPPESRSLLGTDAEAFAATLDAACRDGIEDVLAHLRSDAAAEPD